MASHVKISEGKYRLFVSSGRGVDGKRLRYTRTVTAASDSHAEKLLKEFEKEVTRDELPLPRNMSFRQLWDLFISDHVKLNCKPKTQEWYDERGKRLLAAFGYLKVTAIKPLHISRFYSALKDESVTIADLKGGVSDETVRHYHRALRALFNFAMRYRLVKENLVSCVKLPSARKKHSRAFTDVELPAVFNALADQPLKWQALCITGLTATMRREELVGLKWSDIGGDRVIVSRAVQYTKAAGLIIDGDTKTESSMRVINLPFVTIAILDAWKQEQQKILEQRIAQLKDAQTIPSEVLKHIAELRARLKNFESEYIWNQPDGNPMLPHTVTSWWSKFIKRSGLPPVTFHGTRHTGATISIAEGIDVRSVASRLGHADASTTLRIYAQALESKDRKIAEMWDEILDKNSKWHTDGTKSGYPQNDKK